MHAATGTKWALKVINKLRLSEEEAKLLDRERDILLQLDHPNIVKVQCYTITAAAYTFCTTTAGPPFYCPPLLCPQTPPS